MTADGKVTHRVALPKRFRPRKRSIWRSGHGILGFFTKNGLSGGLGSPIRGVRRIAVCVLAQVARNGALRMLAQPPLKSPAKAIFCKKLENRVHCRSAWRPACKVARWHTRMTCSGGKAARRRTALPQGFRSRKRTIRRSGHTFAGFSTKYRLIGRAGPPFPRPSRPPGSFRGASYQLGAARGFREAARFRSNSPNTAVFLQKTPGNRDPTAGSRAGGEFASDRGVRARAVELTSEQRSSYRTCGGFGEILLRLMLYECVRLTKGSAAETASLIERSQRVES